MQKGQINKHPPLIIFFSHLSMYQRLARHSSIFRSSAPEERRKGQSQWQEFLSGKTIRNSLAANTTELKKDAPRNGSMFGHESQVGQFGYKRFILESLVLELHGDFLLSVMLLGFSMALLEPDHSLHVHS